MPETGVRPPILARLCSLAVALSIFGLPVEVSGAAEGDRAARMAHFVRPKNVPFPLENPFSPEKAELARANRGSDR